MWYIIKPILVTTLWIIMLIRYFIPAFILSCLVLIFFLKIEWPPYDTFFNNERERKWSRAIHFEQKIDNNPIDTFKRYWNGDFW